VTPNALAAEENPLWRQAALKARIWWWLIFKNAPGA
jgi:hypothetical protein